MILALDIGNTNIVVGGLENGEVLFTGRMKTDEKSSADEIASQIDFIMKLNDAPAPEGGIISSVVPFVTGRAEKAIKSLTGREALTVGRNVDIGLDIQMDSPEKVGEDMLVDAVAALAKYEPPMIIFDLGTASTCSIIDKSGSYVGSVIAPGVCISMNALSEQCAKLPRIKLEAPDSIIAKNTDQSMKSGVVFGNAAMMDGIADMVFDELGYEAKIIATGGVACVIVPYCRHEMDYDPDLMLKGLAALWEKNKYRV
ncbi:MAG: type III pantothenate kinase [Clostridia bacterium]|nr:type III pantothenate kinase [Clostridia bacterium]